MTDKNAAAELVKSQSPHDRLKGARWFARFADPSDLGVLKSALRKESVSWVRKALSAAIARLTKPEPIVPSAPVVVEENEDDLQREIYTKVMREVTGALLHEIEPIVGLVRADAADEVPNFSTSKVNAHLSQLANRVEGLRHLREAASAAKADNFDISAFLNDIVQHEIAGRDVVVQTVGPSLIVVGDQRLLTLAIGNGLRNALDAVLSLTEEERRRPIVVTWGITDIDYWVAVLDKGPGLALPPDTAFKIGQSTKKDKGHAGMGLAIAAQAAESMEGEITLAAVADGTRFEIRWYR